MALDIPAQSTVDATLATVGTKATYTGAGTFTVGWLLSSEFGILVGIVIGVAGLAMQFYYSRKKDKREQAEHEQKMRLYD
jgi:MFS superfamily sulfate permease-like transporter